MFARGHSRCMSTSDDAIMPHVLAHYQVVAPFIEASLANTPIVFRHYPKGIDADGVFHVTTVPLSANKLLWLVHAQYAIEFYTWAPVLLDVEALRFGRILLEGSGPGVIFDRVKLAALALRALLFDTAKLEAVPLLDGGTGVALWIPFADAPHAERLRGWLHDLCNRAAALHPDLVSSAYNPHHDGCVHLHVQSNAALHYSAVPYSLRAQGLTVCTPIRWEELGSITGADVFQHDAVRSRIERVGDVFGDEVKVIGGQRFGSSARLAVRPG